ncbi:MAG: CdvA-like protein [Nitrososphaeraceae archaeon]
MSEVKLEFIGKQVKDMYGTYMGKVIGMVTDIDGSIESVSVDCGYAGLKQLVYEQLLVQGDYVIFIPKWRLDVQKLLRQKNLALQRIKALQEMVTANDLMREDVELVYIKYQKRLQDLEDKGKIVLEQLQERLNQIDTESQNIKSVLFDAKLQYRSNEITEETYQQISLSTNDLIEHINLEKGEINNVISRLSQQTFERIDLNSVQTPTMSDQPKSNLSLESNSQSIEGDIPVTGPQAVSAAAADNDNNDNHPKTIRKETDDEAETSWLNEVLQHD